MRQSSIYSGNPYSSKAAALFCEGPHAHTVHITQCRYISQCEKDNHIDSSIFTAGNHMYSFMHWHFNFAPTLPHLYPQNAPCPSSIIAPTHQATLPHLYPQNAPCPSSIIAPIHQATLPHLYPQNAPCPSSIIAPIHQATLPHLYPQNAPCPSSIIAPIHQATLPHLYPQNAPCPSSIIAPIHQATLPHLYPQNAPCPSSIIAPTHQAILPHLYPQNAPCPSSIIAPTHQATIRHHPALQKENRLKCWPYTDVFFIFSIIILCSTCIMPLFSLTTCIAITYRGALIEQIFQNYKFDRIWLSGL